MGSEGWAEATAAAFDMLTQEACAEVAKPEWWNDEGLKALSARVVRAAPDDREPTRCGLIVLAGGVRLGGGASLGGGAQGGGHALRAGCGAVPCSGGGSPARQQRGLVPQSGSRHVAWTFPRPTTLLSAPCAEAQVCAAAHGGWGLAGNVESLMVHVCKLLTYLVRHARAM